MINSFHTNRLIFLMGLVPLCYFIWSVDVNYDVDLDYHRYLNSPFDINVYSKEYLSKLLFTIYYGVGVQPLFFSALQVICIIYLAYNRKLKNDWLYLALLLIIAYTLICINIRLSWIIFILPLVIDRNYLRSFIASTLHIGAAPLVVFSLSKIHIYMILFATIVMLSTLSAHLDISWIYYKIQVYFLFGRDFSIGGISQALIVVLASLNLRRQLNYLAVSFSVFILVFMTLGFTVLASRLLSIYFIYLLFKLVDGVVVRSDLSKYLLSTSLVYEFYRLSRMLGVVFFV